MESYRPQISVIIPAFNSGGFVTAAVNSALSQTMPPCEIIVVNDGSTDDTAERISRLHDHRILYVFQKNGGVSRARNAGIALARGELVAFLDADDIWHPRKLEIQQNVLLARQDLGMIGTACFWWPGPVPQLDTLPSAYPTADVEWDRLVVKNYFTTSAIMVRRDVLLELGSVPFDTGLQGPEDHDLWLRIAARRKVANLVLPLTGYRAHLGGLGNQVVSMQAGMKQILKKLDRARAWKTSRDPFLRRRAYAYFYYSTAYMMRISPGHRTGVVLKVLQSLLAYPLPFRREEATTSWARPKLLALALLRGRHFVG